MRTGLGDAVPLSEDEQRILDSMEQNFYEHDPGLATKVATTTVYKHAGRLIKLATLGFIGGFVLLITQFAASGFLGFLGFLIMLGSLIVIDRNVRRIGKAGWYEVTNGLSGASMTERLGDGRQRLRRRFQRRDDL